MDIGQARSYDNCAIPSNRHTEDEARPEDGSWLQLVEVCGFPHFYGRGVPREPQLLIGATRTDHPYR
eukprot:3749641-Pyramimonas_sp.AAC.1